MGSRDEGWDWENEDEPEGQGKVPAATAHAAVLHPRSATHPDNGNWASQQRQKDRQSNEATSSGQLPQLQLPATNRSTPAQPRSSSSSSSAAAAPAAPASGPKASSGGLGLQGWGLPTGLSFAKDIGAKLQHVAQAAAHDAKQLAETIQQGLIDVAADSESDVERLARYQAPRGPDELPPPAPGAAPAAAPPGIVLAARGAGVAGGEDTEEAARRREAALRRLQGEDGVTAGLKAIDDSVEQLAAGAAKALGSLWGGIGAVARQVSTQVETATLGLAKDMEGATGTTASLQALRNAAEHLGQQLEKGLETVSRNVMEALEPLAGDPPGPRRPGDPAPPRERPAARDAGGFAHSFDLFGGAGALDELCELSNECSRVLNRARAALGPEKTSTMDETLTKLAPIFDADGARGSGGAGAGGSGSGENGDRAERRESEGYGPVVALVNRALKKAELMQSQLLAEAEQQQQEQERRRQEQEQKQQQRAPQQQQDEQRRGSSGGVSEIEPAESESGAGEGDEAGDGEGASGDAAEPEWAALWRAGAVRSLGEICSGQVMKLLQDAKSVAAPARSGRPSHDGVDWPEDDEQLALMLQREAKGMIADLREVGEAFTAPLLAPSAAQLPQAAALAAALETEVAQAVERVRDALREQLFVVLLGVLHRQGRLPARQRQVEEEFEAEAGKLEEGDPIAGEEGEGEQGQGQHHEKQHQGAKGE